MTSTITHIALAVVLGGVLGLGLWSMLAAVPRWGAQPLAQRVAPYVRDVTDPRGTSLPHTAPVDPARLVISAGRAVWRAMLGVGSRVWGASDVVELRLVRAGWSITASQFRERQLALTLGAAMLGALAAVAARVAGNPQPGVMVLPVIFGVVGAVGAEHLLTRAGARRRARIEDELPTVLEFLALCLSAGEGLLDAVKRTSNVGAGELSRELRGVVLAVATSTPLADALNDLAHRVDVGSVHRAIDHLTAALERGAPLADVLRDQAADARDDHKRALIERAGKNEVLMLLPLVFLILPLSVLIAVFPGIAMLGSGFN